MDVSKSTTTTSSRASSSGTSSSRTALCWRLTTMRAARIVRGLTRISGGHPGPDPSMRWRTCRSCMRSCSDASSSNVKYGASQPAYTSSRPSTTSGRSLLNFTGNARDGKASSHIKHIFFLPSTVSTLPPPVLLRGERDLLKI